MASDDLVRGMLLRCGWFLWSQVGNYLLSRIKRHHHLRLCVFWWSLGWWVCQVWRTHRLFRCCLLFLLLGAVFNINRKLGLILVIGFVDISVELEFWYGMVGLSFCYWAWYFKSFLIVWINFLIHYKLKSKIAHHYLLQSKTNCFIRS